MTPPPLGLYVHLPWCERKCPYCDFNSHEIDALPEAAYIDALLRDLESDLALVPGRSVETLFIGGGTPSLFSGEGIAMLVAGIADRIPLAPNLEATMEANPGSAEANRFAAFRAAGINRLSIGVQSFSDTQLAALGRVHNSDQAHRALEYAQAAHFDNVNIDLMHGLPGQDETGASADLATAMALGPAHISWYQLTIEPNTVFFNQPPTLPVEDALATIQLRGEAALAANHYGQYEISAYAREGAQCRHNLNYWHFGDYLGIGAGAHGKLTLASGEVQRIHKRRQPERYMAGAKGGFIAGARPLARDDLVAEFMLNALRLNAGFSVDLFESRTGCDSATLDNAVGHLCERELLQVEDGRVSTTELGRNFLNDVLAEFLPD
ncbi:MAG: radical SAM family heme chaperone HemW [Halioglobus sp.]|nr:radical SAM family heme chaperone HemW [Halioglobus sp.]